MIPWECVPACAGSARSPRAPGVLAVWTSGGAPVYAARRGKRPALREPAWQSMEQTARVAAPLGDRKLLSLERGASPLTAPVRRPSARSEARRR